MPVVEEVYLHDPHTMELRPFQDRVLELVRLFHDAPAVRIRILGTIAAGEPIEVFDGADEAIELHDPDAAVRRHPAFHDLRRYLCPMLQSVSHDAFEVARIITPLLVGLKLSGKLAIELDPWIFAGIALLVERMGVAAFCATYDTDEDEAPELELPSPAQHGHAHRPNEHHRRWKPLGHGGGDPER